jgi:hypothetical protein
MEMRKGLKLSVGLACLVAMAAGGDAIAKTRHSQPAYSVSHSSEYYDGRAMAQGRGPIDVDRRSWLEPGTKVPVGSTNRYMLQQTYYNQDPVQANQRSWYMQETLPQRLPQNVIVPYNEGLPLDWPW